VNKCEKKRQGRSILNLEPPTLLLQGGEHERCGLDGYTTTPLFLGTLSAIAAREYGTTVPRLYPLGDGAARRIMAKLLAEVDVAYDTVRAPDDEERYVIAGEVPVIRDGQRSYEALETLMLRDLPAILDTLMVLEEEYKQLEREKS
jgi:hypothetical protein